MINKITFAELIKSFAEKNQLTQKQAEQVVRSLFSFVIDDLEEKGKATITNFGSFELKRVAARTGINPQTGEEIIIPAHNKVAFKPYKALEEHVNKEFSDLEPKLLDEEDKPSSPKKVDEQPTSPPFAPHPKDDSEKDLKTTEDKTAPEPTSYIDEVLPSSKTDVSEQVTFTSEPETSDSEETSSLPDESSDPFQIEDDEPNEEDFTFNEPDEIKETEKESPFFELDLPDLGDFDDEVPPVKETEVTEEPEPTKVRTNLQDSTPENEAAGSNNEDEKLIEEDIPSAPKAEKNEENPVITWLLVLLLIVVIGAGIWYFFLRDNTPSSAQITETPVENNEVSPTTEVQENETPEITETELDNIVANEPTVSSPQINETETKTTQIVSSNDSESTTSHLVQRDEWMWTISRTVYGKPGLWPLIFESNLSVSDNPDHVVPNQNLAIPPLEGSAFNLTKGDYSRLAKATKFVSEAYAKAGNTSRAAEYLRFAYKYERMSK